MKYLPGLKYSLIMIVICLITRNIYSQNKNELKNLQNKTRQEIEYTNKILDETKEKKEYSINELGVLDYRIEIRKKYIEKLNSEIKSIDKDIEENKELIELLEKDLERVRNEYAGIIMNTYKKREKNILLMYLLASENFNQAYKRIKYVQNYADYKRNQAKLIAAFKKIIDNKIEKLNMDRAEKAKLVREKQMERSNISYERTKKEVLIKELSKKEKELRKEIEEKNKVAEKIKEELRKLIEKERMGKESMYNRLTPEELLISNDFERNKGKLPWPTRYGIITAKYGEQPHPVLKNIMIRNDGVDISTVRDAEVRAVFNGKVSRVFSLPGENYTVIIKHGNFFSLYHNMKNIRVSSGDMVVTKQSIGNVFTDERTKQTILHFQIWKEMNKNDPEKWLSN